MADHNLEILIRAQNQTAAALGEATTGIKQLSEKVEEANGSMKHIGEQSLAMGAQLGAGFALGSSAVSKFVDVAKGVIEFGVDAVKQFVDVGSRIDDLTLKFGASSTAIQEWDFAAKLVGATGEAVGTAVLRMSKNIAEGSNSTRAVIASLGLSFNDLKTMSPEDQFREIARAIADVKSPGEQASDTFKLMGRSAEVLKVIRSDFAEAAEEAHELGLVMSKDSVKAADEFGDATTKLDLVWQAMKRRLGESLISSNDLNEGLRQLIAFMKTGMTDVDLFTVSIQEMGGAFEKVKTPVWKPIAPAATIDFDAITAAAIKSGAEQAKAADKTAKDMAAAAKKGAAEDQRAWEAANREVVADLNERTRASKVQYDKATAASQHAVDEQQRQSERLKRAFEQAYGAIAIAARRAAGEQEAATTHAGDTAISVADRVLENALQSEAEILACVDSTEAEITAAHQKSADAQETVNKLRQQNQLDRFDTLAGAASGILRSIFGKSKAAAIAAAIIDTIAAVVKTMSAYPWPWNLAPAAAAAAAGYAQVQKIRGTDAGFAQGTPGLGFVDFGASGTPTILHNREAVVPEGRLAEFMAIHGGAPSSGGGGTQHIHLHMDGRQIHEVVIARERAGFGRR